MIEGSQLAHQNNIHKVIIEGDAKVTVYEYILKG